MTGAICCAPPPNINDPWITIIWVVLLAGVVVGWGAWAWRYRRRGKHKR